MSFISPQNVICFIKNILILTEKYNTYTVNIIYSSNIYLLFKIFLLYIVHAVNIGIGNNIKEFFSDVLRNLVSK